MSERYDIVGEVRLDISNFEKNADRVITAFARLNNAKKNADATPTGKFEAAAQKLKRAFQEYRDGTITTNKLNAATREFNQAFESLGKRDRARASIRDMRLEMVELNRTIRQTTTAQQTAQKIAVATAVESAKTQRQVLRDQNSAARHAADNQAAMERIRMRTSNAASNVIQRNSISERYALYDVASTWSIASVAILAASAAPIKFATEYDKAMAQVRRTTGLVGSDAAMMRRELTDLLHEIPTDFTAISEIAKLGGQLNINTSGIDEFTSVTAKMTATTDLSAEAAGTALGRFQALLDLPSSKFEALASSILKVGVNSVATETQIVNTTGQIASIAKLAGFTADQVVGLSGAMSSFGISPELSRGVITRVFTEMSNAVSMGGKKLEAFASIAGMSGAEFAESWGTDAFATTFQRFLAGLDVQGDEATRTLAALGVESVRYTPALLKMAQSGDIIAQAFADAATGFEDATELGKQFGVVAETNAAKFTMLVNTIKSGIAAVGQQSSGLLSSVLDVAQAFAQAFEALANNPFGGTVLALVSGLGLLAGAFTAVKATQASLTASSLAMEWAMAQLPSTSLRATTATNTLARAVLRVAIGNQAATSYLTAYGASMDATNSRMQSFVAASRVMGSSLNMNTADFQRLVVAQNSFNIATRTSNAGAATLTSSFASHSAALTAAYPKLRAYNLGLNGVAAGSAAAATGVNVLGAAVRTVAMSLGVTAALVGVVTLFTALSQKSAEAKARVEGLTEAVKADTQAFKETGDAFHTFSLSVADKTSETAEAQAADEEWAETLKVAAYGQDAVKGSVERTTDAIKAQTFAIGENAKAELLDTLYENDGLRKALTENQDLLEEAGFELDTFLQRTLEGTSQAYVNTMYQKYNAELVSLRDGISGYDSALKVTSQAEYDEIYHLGAITSVLGMVSNAAIEADAAMADMKSEIAWGAMLTDGFEVATGEISDGLDGAADDVASFMDTTLAMQNNQVAAANAMSDLGAAVQKNGTSFSMATQAGRDNQAALAAAIQATVAYAGDDSSMLAANLTAIMSTLAGYGVDAVNELSFVSDMITDIVGSSGVTVSYDAISAAVDAVSEAFNQGFTPAVSTGGDAARSAAKEVRTLSDYVSDLSGVFKDAYNFRYGLSSAIDDVADSYDKIAAYGDDAAEAIRDANQAMKDANATIAGLNASNLTLGYQLTVAREYGDTLREADILAEMADNDAKIASATDDRTNSQKDLTAAQKKGKRTLTGMSEGAREQRDLARDLVQEYEAQVVAYAETGVSQDELRRKTGELRGALEDQLLSLGYSKDEVAEYTGSFGDMSQIISRVPRNLTVSISINTSAADKALAEFEAKLKAKKDTTYSGGSVGVTPVIKKMTDAQKKSVMSAMGTFLNNVFAGMGFDMGDAMVKRIATARGDLVRVVDKSAPTGYSYRYRLSDGSYTKKFYSSGGFTGRGGKYDPAGIVHKGEYVVPKEHVNQNTGLPDMNALGSIVNHSATNNYYNGGHVSGPSGPMQVLLMPHQMIELSNLMSTRIMLDGRDLAAASGRSNVANARRGSN